MIEKKFYTAFPSGQHTPLLFQEYRELLIENLLGYLNSIQLSLKMDISFLISKYGQLDISRKFSPAIFSLFAKLVYAAQQGQVPGIIDVLHELSILDDKDIYNAEFEFSTILTEKWETDFINKLRNDHFPNKSGERTLILPIITQDLSDHQLVLSNFRKTIKNVDFDFFQEFETNVTRLKLFNGKALKAATSASVFGAVYMKLPPKDVNAEVYFTEHLIHETSHLYLDILLAFDKVLLNKETEKYKAPIRIDLRPMFGIFHATFVLCRMVRVFQRIIADSPKQYFINRLDTFRRQFEEGLETVEKHAILTEKGQLIKESFVVAAEI